MDSDTIERPDDDAGLYDAGGAQLSDPWAEKQLIGLLLVKPQAIDDAIQLVGTRDFSDPFHRRIFECFVRAHEEGWSVGAPSIVNALGGDAKAIIVDDMTTGAYMARLMADADMAIDPQELAAHIQNCAERRAVGSADDVDFDRGAPFVSHMGLKMWADQNDPGEEYEFICEELIPAREGIVLMGESQTGKSFLTFHLAMCVARAVPFFGRRILRQMGVVWLAYEAATGATARMRAYRRQHGLELDDLPFGTLRSPLAMWPPDEARIKAIIDEIRGIERAKFNGVPLGLVVIDTHNAATPGASEIDSEVASKIRATYRRIIEETGASVVIVGHTNSTGKHRGNEQLTNNIDTIIRVTRKTRMDGREIVPVRDEDGREIRTMRVLKQREGQDGGEHDFVLRVVEDGTRNAFGKARTSCVVVNPMKSDVGDDAAPAAGDDKMKGWRVTQKEALFLRCILKSQAEHGSKPLPQLQLPPAVSAVVDYDVVKRMFYSQELREEDADEEGRKKHRAAAKQALGRARRRLMHDGIIGCHDPWIWWTGKPVRGIKETQRHDPSLFDAPDMSLMGDDDFPDDL